MYRIVFSDIDGTLLNSRHEVTEATARELRRLADRGIPFVLVSARPPQAILPIQNRIGLRAPMVCYSGALVLDGDGTPLESHPIPVETARQVNAFMKERHPAICCNLYAGSLWTVEDDRCEMVREEERITGLKARQLQEAGLADGLFDQTGVHKFLMMGQPEETRRAQEDLRNRFPALSIACSNACYLEVMGAGVKKSVGMDAVCRHFGYDRAQAVAFGDGFNDIDMLQAAGRGYAMANAPEEVRQCTTFQAEDNDHDGLAKALRECFGCA